MNKTLLFSLLVIFAVVLGAPNAIAASTSALVPVAEKPQVEETSSSETQMSKREQRRAERMERRMERSERRGMALPEGLKKALIWYGIAVAISIVGTILSVVLSGIGLGGIIGLLAYVLSTAAALYATYLLIMWLIEEA